MKASSWYEEPWLWFIVGIVLTAMAWGGFLLATAIRHQDGVVIDDYYKHGKTVNISTLRQQNAERFGMEATIIFQPNTVVLSLYGDMEQRPERLTLLLISPVDANADQRIELEKIPAEAQSDQPSHYMANATITLQGNIDVQLETQHRPTPEVGHTDGWRLRSKVTMPFHAPIHLSTTDIKRDDTPT